MEVRMMTRAFDGRRSTNQDDQYELPCMTLQKQPDHLLHNPHWHIHVWRLKRTSYRPGSYTMDKARLWQPGSQGTKRRSWWTAASARNSKCGRIYDEDGVKDAVIWVFQGNFLFLSLPTTLRPHGEVDPVDGCGQIIMDRFGTPPGKICRLFSAATGLPSIKETPVDLEHARRANWLFGRTRFLGVHGWYRTAYCRRDHGQTKGNRI